MFNYGKNRHMVRDNPQNRRKAGGNATPRPNHQNAATAEPRKIHIFYALKRMEE